MQGTCNIQWLAVVVLQREARGSVTLKVVPSYRNTPVKCDVSVDGIVEDSISSIASFVFLSR